MSRVTLTKSVITLNPKKNRKKSSVMWRMESLQAILPTACATFQCPYEVTVRNIKRDDYLNSTKFVEAQTSSRGATVKRSPEYAEDKLSQKSTISCNVDAITVYAVYNVNNIFTEILLTKLRDVPCILMKTLGILAPYYRSLVKMSIKRSVINMYVVYELNKMIQLSKITDVYLDDSPIPGGGDYSLLLDSGSIRVVSLARCNIDDKMCEQIASKLPYLHSGQYLSVLNLSSNFITDEGAKHISQALRSNRSLRYLNLSGNQITDKGSVGIFDVLTEFKLTFNEIMLTRKRHIDYLLRRQKVSLKVLAQHRITSIHDFRTSTARKNKPRTSLNNKVQNMKNQESILLSMEDDTMKTKIYHMATDKMGQFEDPFHGYNVKIYDTVTICVGNLALSYLNMSYNNLSYLSVQKLHSVILYQSVTKIPNQTGLVKILIDGNDLPVNCSEYAIITELLDKKYKTAKYPESPYIKGHIKS